MTRQCAVSYFDDGSGSFGYAIGSDSASRAYEVSNDWSTLLVGIGNIVSMGLLSKMVKRKESEVFTDKSFSGENYIGFHAGTSLFVRIRNSKSSHRGGLDNLDNFFNDIDDGTVYEDISNFRGVDDYSLLIAKRNEDSVELYTVTRQEGSKGLSIATRLHRLDPDSFSTSQGSRVWYKPDIILSPEDTPDGYWQETLVERLDLLSAKSEVIEFLTNPPVDIGDYNPGQLSVYKVNPQEFSRI